MIESLADHLPDFPGAANSTPCFTHILNLVAKCIMKQFDTPKSKRMGLEDDDMANEVEDDEDLENLQKALYALEDEVEEEDEENIEDDRIGDEEIDEMQRAQGNDGERSPGFREEHQTDASCSHQGNCLSNCHVTLQLTRFSFARLCMQSNGC
jgi:hypothetical protein